MRILALTLMSATMLAPTIAHADITIGAILSLTGPGASLGIPEKNTLDILPKEIDGEAVNYIILDDASDPSAAVRNAIKLVNEDQVDVIVGPTLTATSLAILETVAGASTPMISLSGSQIISDPVEGPKEWSFKLAPTEQTQAAYVYDQMQRDGDKTIGFIGFNDAFGDSFIGAFKEEAEKWGVEVLADERYGRQDSSVTAQALQIISANPDAVMIGASGTPGVTPVLELRNLGYEGQIYINQGMANPDVLRVGGEALNGVMLAVSPALVAEQLADDNVVKPVAVEYVTAYEEAYGEGTRSLFGATAWDAFLLIEAAVPRAREAGEPGTAEFRTALRDAMQTTEELVGAEGVFTMTPENHNGTDIRASSLVRIEDGKWVYIPTSPTLP